MNLAWFGSHLCYPVIRRAIDDGHSIRAIFPTLASTQLIFPMSIRDVCSEFQAPIFLHKPTAGDIERLIETDVELLVSIGYQHKIPIDPRIHAINIHPTMLPKFRGPSPLEAVVKAEGKHFGVTIHKLSGQIDAGDILCQRQLGALPTDDVETLMARFNLGAMALLSECLKRFPDYWANATPQSGEATVTSSLKTPQILDFHSSVGPWLKRYRMCVPGGAIVQIDEKNARILFASAWEEAHELAAGTLIYSNGQSTVVTLNDGFLLLRLASY